MMPLDRVFWALKNRGECVRANACGRGGSSVNGCGRILCELDGPGVLVIQNKRFACVWLLMRAVLVSEWAILYVLPVDGDEVFV